MEDPTNNHRSEEEHEEEELNGRNLVILAACTAAAQTWLHQVRVVIAYLASYKEKNKRRTRDKQCGVCVSSLTSGRDWATRKYAGASYCAYTLTAPESDTCNNGHMLGNVNITPDEMKPHFSSEGAQGGSSSQTRRGRKRTRVVWNVVFEIALNLKSALFEIADSMKKSEHRHEVMMAVKAIPNLTPEEVDIAFEWLTMNDKRSMQFLAQEDRSTYVKRRLHRMRADASE